MLIFFPFILYFLINIDAVNTLLQVANNPSAHYRARQASVFKLVSIGYSTPEFVEILVQALQR